MPADIKWIARAGGVQVLTGTRLWRRVTTCGNTCCKHLDFCATLSWV